MKPFTRNRILPAVSVILITLACNLSSRSPSPTSTPAPASPTSITAAPTAQLSTSTAEPLALPSATLPLIESPTAAVLPSPTVQVQPEVEYAVVLVEENDVLNVRKGAGADQPSLANLKPGSAGISLTGQERRVGDDRWVEIRHPQAGSGWVNAYYLTEAVSPAAFCADDRVKTLVADLDRAITTGDGRLLAALVSPAHGLNVHYFRDGEVANYSQVEADWIFESDYGMNWGIHPASGLEVKGAFQDVVLPSLLDVFESEYTLECNAPDLGGGNYTYAWPVEYAPINYYLIHKPGTPGIDLDWRSYLVGVEYVNGKPALFSLIHFFWEP